MCVCVCVRERERQRQKERGTFERGNAQQSSLNRRERSIATESDQRELFHKLRIRGKL